MAKRKVAEQQPTHKPPKAVKRSRPDEAKKAAKEYADDQREIAKKLRRKLH